MTLTITKLESGYVRVSGDGPCNWWQGPHWPPQTHSELYGGFFDEAGDAFRNAVIAAIDDFRGDDGLVYPPPGEQQ